MKSSIGLFLLVCSFSFSQEVLYGTVFDSETKQPLPDVSVYLASQLTVKTISSLNGEFILELNQIESLDSITFYLLGYKTVKISAHRVSPISINLEPNVYNLQEVTLTDETPTEYILRAISLFEENYSSEPFVSYSDYNFFLSEEKESLLNSHSKIKTYHTNFQEKEKDNQYQVLSYEVPEKLHELKFMKKKVDRSNKRAEKRAERKGSSPIEEGYFDLKQLENPKAPFSSDPITVGRYFMDEKTFKKYDYTFEERCNTRNLTIIAFKTERFNNIASKGRLYFDCENDALIKIEVSANFNPSIAIKTMMWVAGISIDGNSFESKIEYKKKENGFWYPIYYIHRLSIDIEKTKLFSENIQSSFLLKQNLYVKKIVTDNVSEILEDKRYNPKKLLKDQVNSETF